MLPYLSILHRRGDTYPSLNATEWETEARKPNNRRQVQVSLLFGRNPGFSFVPSQGEVGGEEARGWMGGHTFQAKWTFGSQSLSLAGCCPAGLELPLCSSNRGMSDWSSHIRAELDRAWPPPGMPGDVYGPAHRPRPAAHFLPGTAQMRPESALAT